MDLPWLVPPHCAASEQLLQTLACDCGSESLWVLERCLASPAPCIGGKSCAEGLLFCKINTLCWADTHTLLNSLSCNLRHWKQTRQKTLSTHPWNTAPAKWPPPVIRMTHTVLLLMAFSEDAASCSSSDWNITGTKHVIRIKNQMFVNIHITHCTMELLSLTFPCRMQRYTDRYCPAEFWKTTLLESRPLNKLVSAELSLSVPVTLLYVPPLSLSESSSESDSEPEILDMSPVKR